jgi:hypothetical protein
MAGLTFKQRRVALNTFASLKTTLADMLTPQTRDIVIMGVYEDFFDLKDPISQEIVDALGVIYDAAVLSPKQTLARMIIKDVLVCTTAVVVVSLTILGTVMLLKHDVVVPAEA